MKTLHLVPVLAALLLLALAGCTVASGREIGIAAGERNSNPAMYFEPKRVTARAGENVTFVVRNDGAVDHEFESGEAGIGEVIVPPGRTRRVAFEAPSKPGEYPVYCDLAGHREAGMELVLVVE